MIGDGRPSGRGPLRRWSGSGRPGCITDSHAIASLHASLRYFPIVSPSASLASNLIETVEHSAAASLGRETADR